MSASLRSTLDFFQIGVVATTCSLAAACFVELIFPAYDDSRNRALQAIEGILEEGLTPEEVDGLLGRRAAFQGYEASIWDRLQDADPAFVGKFLLREHPQTIAYILSMLPS